MTRAAPERTRPNRDCRPGRIEWPGSRDRRGRRRSRRRVAVPVEVAVGDGARLSDLPVTSWTLVAAVRAEGDAARPALEEFVRRYHGPVLAYVTVVVRDAELASDLTQSFFASHILTGRLARLANASRGSFRPYLKRAIRNFCTDALRSQMRERRNAGAASVPIDALLADPAPGSRPDDAFHLEWIRGLLEQALARVRRRCEARDQVSHFEIFSERYLDARGETPAWAEIGARHGLDEKAARGRAETVARTMRAALLEILTVEAGSRRAAEAELATIGVLFRREDR